MYQFFSILAMCKLLLIPIVFLLFEILLTLLFYIMVPGTKKNDINGRSIIKGIVERIFLIIALVNGYSQALALFGVLKGATRLSNKDEIDPRYNDYYLVGNLTSAMSAMIFVYVYNTYLR